MASYKVHGVERVDVTAPDGTTEWLEMRTSTSMSAQTQIAVDAQKTSEGEALVRFTYAHVRGWSLKDEAGDPVPMSFELFDALPWLATAALKYLQDHGFLPQQVFADQAAQAAAARVATPAAQLSASAPVNPPLSPSS